MKNQTKILTKLVHIILLFHYATSYNLKYTIQSRSVGGEECMTDCDDQGQCWISHNKQERCNHGSEKAPTYFTSRNRYPSITECHSKCVFDGYGWSWCYIDDNSHWDYCSAETNAVGKWYQNTKDYGWCENECEKHGYSYLWCETKRKVPSWDYCEESYHYAETAKTIYGDECKSECLLYQNSYYLCYEYGATTEKCAPSGLNHVCPYPAQGKSKRDVNDSERNENFTRTRRSRPPRRTVAEYSQDIDNQVTTDADVHTVTLSSRNRIDPDNPILDYTYRNYFGIRLPLRVRSIIHPCHRNRGPRNGRGVLQNARNNCEDMGMNRNLPNRNNDQYGHLIPYILRGPGDWYNIVPQTRLINTGSSEGLDIEARSIWAITERNVRITIDSGGSVEYNVVVTYDLPHTRPTGFGVSERHLTSNGALDYECLGYWHSNDPNVDPDVWNLGSTWH